MAIGVPTLICQADSDNTSASSKVFTTTVAVAAGESIIVGIGCDTNLDGVVVTDSVGNTYTTHADVLATNNGTVSTQIASAHNVTALPSGGTITVSNSPAAGGYRRLMAYKVSGLATSGAFDQVATSNSAVNPWTIGPTGTLAQADELAFFYVIENGNHTNTPPAGWTELRDSGSGSLQVVTAYKITSATAAVSGGGTWNATPFALAAAMVTFKGVSAPVQRNKTRVSGAFAAKPIGVKASGAFATKTVKVKIGGAFV